MQHHILVNACYQLAGEGKVRTRRALVAYESIISVQDISLENPPTDSSPILTRIILSSGEDFWSTQSLDTWVALINKAVSHFKEVESPEPPEGGLPNGQS